MPNTRRHHYTGLLDFDYLCNKPILPGMWHRCVMGRIVPAWNHTFDPTRPGQTFVPGELQNEVLNPLFYDPHRMKKPWLRKIRKLTRNRAAWLYEIQNINRPRRYYRFIIGYILTGLSDTGFEYLGSWRCKRMGQTREQRFELKSTSVMHYLVENLSNLPRWKCVAIEAEHPWLLTSSKPPA